MIPSEFLALAQRLVQTPDLGAAGLRSAIWRAYYGGYLSVRAFLEKELATPCRAGGVSEHQMVQRYLINSQVTEAIELGHMLGTLQQARKEADYEMANVSPENQQVALLNVDRALRILEKLEHCSAPTIRQKLKAGITQYRRLIKEL
jgi:uncharacterized protein (UPF0332 family)